MLSAEAEDSVAFYFYKGIYKDRVENDGNIFEIPALLSCKWGNSAENGVWKIQKIYVCMIKER